MVRRVAICSVQIGRQHESRCAEAKRSRRVGHEVPQLTHPNSSASTAGCHHILLRAGDSLQLGLRSIIGDNASVNMALFIALLASLAGVVLLWLTTFVALSISTTVQRHLFYAHKAPIWWRQKLLVPESFGFCRHQVVPLRIPTPGGASLFAWLVAPLGLYAAREDDFLKNPDAGLKILAAGDSKLVIYFHGVAGTVGQTRRTDAYRMAGGTGSWVLAFDYRGFGFSTGSPDETGLIQDALAMIRWARTVGNIPTERIVLLAQSLGTAVVAGALEKLIGQEPDLRFAAVIMCASFMDAPSMFVSYSVFGLPLLAPLNMSPVIKRSFVQTIKDKWQTEKRLEKLVRDFEKLQLTFVAATSDQVSAWRNTEELFYAAIGSVVRDRIGRTEIDEASDSIDLHEGGSAQTWRGGGKVIRKVVMQYGGGSPPSGVGRRALTDSAKVTTAL